jgi:hypothetical protein
MDIAAIRHELKIVLGIDNVTPNVLPESFRKQVLNDSIIV